jgi:23S rRNA (cytosine1962-C5)-methyltransferase
MSTAWPDYELLDFGDGRKLERFSSFIYDRPAPAAAGYKKQHPKLWQQITTRYVGDRVAGGRWSSEWPECAAWPDGEFDPGKFFCDVRVGRGFKLLARPREAGQVGVFPEQFQNWNWIAKQVERIGLDAEVLNLFAYSGASTLAAAAAGAHVTHLDAAKQSVDLASRNANFSKLNEAPIRWIIDDAMKFCQREVRRKRHYDAVILDPPTYGHGPKREEWNIRRDLLPLLTLCGELTERRPKFVLLTCHSPGVGPAELSAYLSEGIFGACGQPPRTGELFLETAEGRRLPSGVFARWPG